MSTLDEPAAEARTAPARWPGITFALAGCLLLAKAVLDGFVGPPPPGQALTSWHTDHATLLALTNEAIIISAVLLTPGLIALHQALRRGRRALTAATGCAIIAASIPVTVTLGIVHGRLMYPVYHADVSDLASLRLIVNLYYGGQHAVALMLFASLLLLAPALGAPPFGRPHRYATVAAAIACVLIAYPELVGQFLLLVAEAALAGWFITIGIRLARPPERQVRNRTGRRSQDGPHTAADAAT